MADDPIPQDLADEVLAKCARHCCICRRFKPLYLQVHHIVVRSEGGGNDPDNLIAVCLTCHSDVHTRTPFTRRFTVGELKRHREEVYRLIAEVNLPGVTQDLEVQPAADVARVAMQILKGTMAKGMQSELRISDTACEILIEAAQSSHGSILVVESFGGSTVQVDGKELLADASTRTFARFSHAIQELLGEGLIERKGYEDKVFQITHPGYVFADELMAAAAQRQAD